MKLLVYIALWKRPEITKMCFDNLLSVKKQSELDIDVFCVVSREEDAELCSSYGYDYTYAENQPLGQKFNKGLKEAMKKDFDYLIQCGSDDIITLKYIDYIKPYLYLGEPYFGVKTYFPIDLENKTVKKWTYEVNHPIGLGRCFTKKVLRAVLKEGELWPNEIVRGLDTHSDVNMILAGYRCKLLPMKERLLYGIKSDENINSYAEMGGEKDEVFSGDW